MEPQKASEAIAEDGFIDLVDHWFTYHPPTGIQPSSYTAIIDSGKDFAMCILRSCPPSADRLVAIRKVREAVMTANAAIACGGR